MFRHHVMLLLITVSLAGCDSDDATPAGGNASDAAAVQWISVGVGCEELAELEGNPDGKENVGLMMCSNAHKSFTGELRCERNYVEVACR